jgi:beta-glucosidase
MANFSRRAIQLMLTVFLFRAYCLAQTVTPEQRADAIIQKMTLDEKIAQLHGVIDTENDRWIPGIERLGIPALPMANGPAGIGPAGLIQPRATAFPAPITVAASWDTADAREYGAAVAGEIRAIGRTMLEAPTVNIARIPTSGRTFEGYGEDPFLTSKIGVANIEGIQSLHVIANVKHFALNNQEANRQFVDAFADERTMREIYFPAFEAAIKVGHVASLMCSYNKVNGQYACENKSLMTDVLRKDWGFDGFIVSDFWAAHDGIEDAKAGMDLEMPTGKTYNENFESQVRDGKIPISQIDAFLRHRYVAMIRLGLFDIPITTSPLPETANGRIAQRLASDGMVLLRNENGVLPLDTAKQKTIAVIGPAADVLVEGGGAASVLPLHTITPIQALRARFGDTQIHYVPVGGVGFIDPHDTVDGYALAPPASGPDEHGVLAEYFDNTSFSGTPKVVRTERIPETLSEFGAPVAGLTGNFSLRWTAILTPPASGTYTFGTEMWGKMRLFLDGKLLIDQMQSTTALEPRSATIHLEAGHAYPLRAEYISLGRGVARVFWQMPEGIETTGIAKAVEAAQHADAAIVFAGAWAHEGFDRSTLALPGSQDRLIEAVAKANPRTIVVLQSGEPVLMPWIHNVAAVVEAWFPGEEGGSAIAGILAGDINPSGKLPITFPANDVQVPASTPEQYPGISSVEHYSEGLFVGYRWYDAEGHTPLFPFGFGLSYTHFEFTKLSLSRRRDGSLGVRATMTNRGKRAGAEVAQLYLSYPKNAHEPPHQLRAFSKVQLEPEESKQLSFTLDPRSFSYWSMAEHRWKTAPGPYMISVGDSSRDLSLQESIIR